LSRCPDDRVRFAGGFGLDCSTALEGTLSLPAVPCSAAVDAEAPAPAISAGVSIIVAVRFRLDILVDVIEEWGQCFYAFQYIDA
jgi:hypothetical protein